MPNFAYNFLGGGGACAAGPGQTLPGLPAPIFLTYPQLINAQLRLGVYPPGWVADEMAWRTYSFVITVAPLAAAGGMPPMPAAGIGGVGAAAVAAVGGPNLPPSPVAIGVDTTEKGQLGYHMGTAVGGSLIEYLFLPGGVGGFTTWYPFHLSRAVANGGVFNYATLQRPDIVIYAVNPLTLVLHRFVVWENKGHCINFGGAAAIAPALAQAQSLTNMTSIPGNPALGVFGGTPCALFPPHCYVASMVDLTGVGGNFRVQVIDPPGPSKSALKLSEREADNFLKGYYAPFVEAIKTGSAVLRKYDGRSFLTINLPKQVSFGLDEAIFRAWSRKESFAAEVGRILSVPYVMSSPTKVYLHATGISTEIPSNWAPWPSKSLSPQ